MLIIDRFAPFTLGSGMRSQIAADRLAVAHREVSMSRRTVLVVVAVLLVLSPVTALAALVAEYNFTGNPNDSSGNALHGTNNGATLTADRFGNASSAYSFDGSATIEVPHNPLLNATTGEWSMSGWIQSTVGGLILGMGGSHPSYGLRAFKNFPGIADDVDVVAWCCEGGHHLNAIAISGIVLDGEWHHIAGTLKNNDIAKLYVDGALVSTDDPTGGSGQWNIGVSEPFWIGDVSGAFGDPFVGTIDDVKLFNHVLSDSEVAALAGVPESSSVVLVLVATISMATYGRRIFRP